MALDETSTRFDIHERRTMIHPLAVVRSTLLEVNTQPQRNAIAEAANIVGDVGMIEIGDGDTG